MTGFFPESAITDLTESDPDAPEFLPEEYTARMQAVRTALTAADCPIGLLTSPESIYYCTGLNHQGHFAFTALVLPVEGEPVLVAREMERPTVEAQATACCSSATPTPTIRRSPSSGPSPRSVDRLGSASSWGRCRSRHGSGTTSPTACPK